MPKAEDHGRPAKPDAVALRELAATADPSIPPAVMPVAGSEIVTVRLSTGLVDQLDTKADASPAASGRVSDNGDPPAAGPVKRPFRIYADNPYVDDAKERWRMTKTPDPIKRLIIALQAIEGAA